MKVNEKRVFTDADGKEVEAVVKVDKSLKEIGKETLDKHPKLTKWGKRVATGVAIGAAFVGGMIVAKSSNSDGDATADYTLPPVTEPEVLAAQESEPSTEESTVEAQ